MLASVLANASAPDTPAEDSPRRAAFIAARRSSLSRMAIASLVMRRAMAFIHRATWPVLSRAHRVPSHTSHRRHGGT